MSRLGAPSLSDLEETLAFHLRAEGIPFEREYKFHPKRRWRYDFLIWPNHDIPRGGPGILVEVQGGLDSNGRHSREAGYRNDAEKLFHALMAGYFPIFVTRSMINDGRAVQMIREASLSDV